MALTSPQIEAFREQGFLFPLSAMPPERAAETLQALIEYEQIIDKLDDEYLALHKRFPKVHLLADWADALVHDAQLLDNVSALLGPDLLVWSSGVFWKARGAPPLAWHQDVAYYGLSYPEEAVRVWISLTPATIESGTMRFLPGSQKQGILKHELRLHHGQDSRGDGVCVAVDEAHAVSVEVEAGQYSIHQSMTLHASGSNTASYDRVAFTVDYVTPRVRPLVGQDAALLVRGDDHGMFLRERRPRGLLAPSDIDQYLWSVGLRDRQILERMKDG
jgi:non-haem Fe2+, alpha-ketoglutarate-dependent halogenase